MQVQRGKPSALRRDEVAYKNCLLRFQGFTGSGTSCRPLESCVDNEGICHPNAVCAWNTEGYYACRCRDGYRGDGYVCQGKLNDSLFDKRAIPRKLCLMCLFSFSSHTKARRKIFVSNPRNVNIARSH